MSWIAFTGLLEEPHKNFETEDAADAYAKEMRKKGYLVAVYQQLSQFTLEQFA